MSYFIGRNREARQTYGFDEIALVPGNIGVDPDDTDISFSLGDLKFKIPFLASAMDGVVNTGFAAAMNKSARAVVPGMLFRCVSSILAV